MKNLIVICNNYPFGHGETFLATEMEYISRSFKNIIIVSKNSKEERTRNIPSNASVVRYNTRSNVFQKFVAFSQILISFRYYLDICLEEMGVIREVYGYRISINLIRKMIHDLVKAVQLKYFIQKKLKSFQSDSNTIFYTYWQDSGTLTLTFLKRKNPKLKIVSRTHRGDLYFYAQKDNYLSFRKYISEHLDRLYFISEDALHYQSQLLGLKFQNFKIERLGTKGTERKKPVKKDDYFVLVSCSNVINVKRIHLIVEILSLLKNYPVRWVHIGDGPLMSELKGKTKMLLSDTSIHSEFMGALSNAQVLKFYAENHVDLFINVSESEGIPVSIMEAMSFGIPVMATNVGGTGEIVDSSNGILLDVDFSCATAANQMKNLLTMDERAKQKMEENAFATWKERYSAEVNYSNFVKDLEQL